MSRKANFNAGPAALPPSVLQRLSEAVLEIKGSGLSILEISHRSKIYEEINEVASQKLLSLMDLSPSDYSVLFMGGGASLQFAMLPMNFLGAERTATYIHTGEWSKKAIEEARHFGHVVVGGSSEDKKFSYLPSYEEAPSSVYTHFTTNNTIEGTQWEEMPQASAPLVADMSSDFLSRVLEFERFSFVYAGAQKNAGPAGVTIIVVRNNFLEQANQRVPNILSYNVLVKAKSLYNTPPVFQVLAFSHVLDWIVEQGGLSAVEKKNREKAEMLYRAIETRADLFSLHVMDRKFRSQMNVCFRMQSEELENRFVKEAEKLGMIGLKGHRSVGGLRASIYNAVSGEDVSKLCDFVTSFKI